MAIYSNSGNFTTTIAQYLATAGWGTTTLISSGKDVYIHFAAREFVHALANDNRCMAAVMYAEPGGYYEQDAVLPGRLWRAWSDAGSRSCRAPWVTPAPWPAPATMPRAKSAGSWRRSASTHFHPGPSRLFRQGAVVINIAHIPLALTKVMELNGVEPDFPPRAACL